MNILITGATGLLGRALIKTDTKKLPVTGLYIGSYKMKDSKIARYHCLDIQDTGRLNDLFSENKIDMVIHTAGIADVDLCERDHDIAYRSNVVGTQNIVDECLRTGAKLVYISTNAVFDGKKAPYGEKDAVNPVNNYGRIKLECENMVKDRIASHLIVRPILMYGWNDVHERKNLVTWLLEKLPKGEFVNMVTDIYDNPLLSYHCAEAIWRLIDMRKTGTYHVADKDIVNRYEFALTIAEAFGLDKGLIKPVDSSFFPAIAPRPINTSYDTSKLEAETGFIPLSLAEGLARMKKMGEVK